MDSGEGVEIGVQQFQSHNRSLPEEERRFRFSGRSYAFYYASSVQDYGGQLRRGYQIISNLN